MISSRSFVETVIEMWLASEPALSHVLISSNVRRLPDGSKIAIELQTTNHLALIEAWEYATCLDTTIHRLDAAQGTILAAGSCASSDAAEERLVALCKALSETSI